MLWRRDKQNANLSTPTQIEMQHVGNEFGAAVERMVFGNRVDFHTLFENDRSLVDLFARAIVEDLPLPTIDPEPNYILSDPTMMAFDCLLPPTIE